MNTMPLKASEAWFLKKGPDYVKDVRLKVKRYFDACEQLGLLQQWRMKYASYFMQQGERGLSRADSTFLDLGTRKKPDVKVHVPELRSLVRQQLSFLLAEPISFQVVSRTGQQRSVMGSEVGEKACNYVYDEYIKPSQVELTEHLECYGAAASHLRWDTKKGDDVVETYKVPLTDPATGQPVPEQSMSDDLDEQGNPIPNVNPDGSPVPVTDDDGNIVPKLIEQKKAGKSGAPYRDALDPTMFAYDPKIGPKANWAVAFEQTNLYVLAAKFADYVHPVTGEPFVDQHGQQVPLSEEILKQKTIDEYANYRLFQWQDTLGANEGDVFIMHVYYADSIEYPKGRYDIIIGDLSIEMGECPLPAGRLPVRLALNSKFTDNYLSFADSSMLMPIEESINRIRSDELGNFAYYGKQTRWQEAGSKVISGESTSGGKQRVIEGPRGAAPPQMLPINAIPNTESVKKDYLDSLSRVSGFGDVSRGNIDDTTSGTHAAVFEAITARNLSLPQAQVIEHETAVMNDVLEMMQRYGNVEFIAEIAGKSGMPLARSFAPEDFSTIRRLVAKPIPDAMRGPLARIKVVELTKDIQDPRERAKAVQMITRGDDEYGKNDSRSLNLIAIENEWLLSGDYPVVAGVTDDGYAHCQDHRAALDEYRTQPDADGQVIMRFLTHLEEHAQLEENKNPVLCKLLNLPDPPVLPGNNAFVFAQRIEAAQQMLHPQPPPGSEPGQDPKAEKKGPPQAAAKA
jgi:hypothetical protein